VKIKVKLYGTLRHRVAGYHSPQGLEVEIPDEATAKDLLDTLKIPGHRGAVFIMEGRILNADDKLRHGALLDVFETIHGG